jgi:predicted dehydrogenase
MTLSRRSLLKRGSAATAAVAFPYVVGASALGLDGERAASERVTVALIGCGGRGSAVARGLGGQLVAACDPWQTKRARFAGATLKPYADFRELLDRSDLDAVVVATPDHWHVPITIAAAKAGKHVYCEKPLGVSVQEDRACRAAVRRYGTVFQYGTQQRSMASNRLGCELVRNGRIGELRQIVVSAPGGGTGGNSQPLPVPPELDYEMWLGPAPWSPYTGCPTGAFSWYFAYDYALGFIAGWGAHPLDVLVWGFDTHKHGPWEVEGTGVIDAGGRNNAVARWDVHITFANGVKLHFVDGDNFTKFIGTQGWVSIPRGPISAEPKSLLTSPIRPDEIRLPESRGHGLNFIEAIRAGRDPVSNIEDAVRSDIISHVSDIAIRLKRKLIWDPVKECFVGDEQANRCLGRGMREPWRL